MRDRTVVITGASEGIGRALTVALAERGARLVLAARKAESLAAVAKECERAGGAALAVPTDVANLEDCRRLIVQAVERFGGIDILVNNAGISMREPFESARDLTLYERLMRVNYLGAVYCTHAALPHLKASRGLLVAISSLQGKTGFPTYAGYAASKHAVQGFFDSLRIELAGSGVDVLVVSPGAVATDIHHRHIGGPGESGARPPPPEPAAMPVNECVRQIVRAMERRDRELVMTAAGKAGAWLKVLAPGLVDRMVARAIRRFHGD